MPRFRMAKAQLPMKIPTRRPKGDPANVDRARHLVAEMRVASLPRPSLQTLVVYECLRCGHSRTLPDDGRIYGDASVHMAQECPNAPAPASPRLPHLLTFDDGLVQVHVGGRAWIRSQRIACFG